MPTDIIQKFAPILLYCTSYLTRCSVTIFFPTLVLPFLAACDNVPSFQVISAYRVHVVLRQLLSFSLLISL